MAIARKTVTGQYKSSTVLQQVNVQSGCYILLRVGSSVEHWQLGWGEC